MSMTATTKGGCTVNSGFMGETCPVCGADNFGGNGFCQTKEERELRMKVARHEESPSEGS